MMNIDLNNIFAALNGVQQQDSMGEFTHNVSKEQLIDEHKEQTNFKWMLWDGLTSVAGMAINQYRQKQFQHLEKDADKAADEALKEREMRLQNLKDNLGISKIEERLDKQDKVLNDIKGILGQLQSMANKNKMQKEKVKDLHPAIAKISKKKEVEEDEEFT